MIRIQTHISDSEAQALNWWFKEKRRKCADTSCQSNALQTHVVISKTQNSVTGRAPYEEAAPIFVNGKTFRREKSFNLTLPILWMTILSPNLLTSKGSCYNHMRLFLQEIWKINMVREWKIPLTAEQLHKHVGGKWRMVLNLTDSTKVYFF